MKNSKACPLMGQYMFCHLDDDGESPLQMCGYVGHEKDCPANQLKQSSVLTKAAFNSFYPAPPSPTFIPHNPVELADKVTEEGKRAMREMMEHLSPQDIDMSCFIPRPIEDANVKIEIR